MVRIIKQQQPFKDSGNCLKGIEQMKKYLLKITDKISVRESVAFKPYHSLLVAGQCDWHEVAWT